MFWADDGGLDEAYRAYGVSAWSGENITSESVRDTASLGSGRVPDLYRKKHIVAKRKKGYSEEAA